MAIVVRLEQKDKREIVTIMMIIIVWKALRIYVYMLLRIDGMWYLCDVI